MVKSQPSLLNGIGFPWTNWKLDREPVMHNNKLLVLKPFVEQKIIY